MKRVGLITIGQSPRIDVVPEIKGVSGDSSIEVVECGALDKLSKEEIKALAPKESDYVLVTRLRDGSEVKVAREKILPLMQECINTLEPLVDVLGVLCTGEFPELRSKKLLVEPSELLLKVVESLKVSKLGVVVPDPAQVGLTEKKWRHTASDISVLSVSPYTGTLNELRKVSEKLRDRDLIVLDCIGFSAEAKRVVAAASRRPVLIPRTLLARVLRELVEV
ncbi:MAG: AroM family protein [Thermoprotei archaeon]